MASPKRPTTKPRIKKTAGTQLSQRGPQTISSALDLTRKVSNDQLINV